MANLLVVMLLGGLWHGAAWTFILWGLLHGLVLAAERLAGWKGIVTGWRGVLAAIVAFHVVCAGWILFRSPTVAGAAEIFLGLFAAGPAAQRATPYAVGLILLGLALHWLPPGWLGRLERRVGARPAWALGLAAGVLLVAIDAAGPDGVAPSSISSSERRAMRQPWLETGDPPPGAPPDLFTRASPVTSARRTGLAIALAVLVLVLGTTAEQAKAVWDLPTGPAPTT